MFYSDECKREIRVSSPLSALRLLRIRVTSLVGRLSESSFHASERRATIKAILNLRRNDALVALFYENETIIDSIFLLASLSQCFLSSFCPR